MGNTYNRVYIWCCKYGENRYCERSANKKLCASKHTGLLNSCLGKLCLHPYLVVPHISARVTLISTRVSAHCQAIQLAWTFCQTDISGNHLQESHLWLTQSQSHFPGYWMEIDLPNNSYNTNHSGVIQYILSLPEIKIYILSDKFQNTMSMIYCGHVVKVCEFISNIYPWWRHQMETFSALLTGPLCGEFSSHRWIPCTKASNAELWCFLWSAPE